MGNITKNLSRHEFACPCSRGEDAVDAELAFAIQESVDNFQALHPNNAVKCALNSANRCLEYNRSLVDSKGRRLSKDDSQHVLYKAVDYYLYLDNVENRIPDDDLATYLENKYPDKYGIGRYVGRTHLDVRINKRRWDRR